jgi:hypothetical protein
VLGVFELFSGKPHAFAERDLSALQRLSEMVETAVKYAMAAPIVLPAPELPVSDPRAPGSHPVEPQPSVDATAQASGIESVVNSDPAPAENISLPELEQTELKQEEQAPEKTKPEQAQPAPKKPFFWSAALQTSPSAVHSNDSSASLAVPPMLRNLQKCEACGFPVSPGRTFCIECEEKQWRGQRLPQSAAAAAVSPAPHQEVEKEKQPTPDPSVRAVVDAPETPATKNLSSTQTEEPATATLSDSTPVDAIEDTPPIEPTGNNSTLFLSSAQPSESWLAKNKYILGALLVVAIAIAAIAWLR